MAPFWRGLNDFSDSWTENQLVAAARGKLIPAPDEIPDEDEPRMTSREEPEPKTQDFIMNSLTVPISSRSQSVNSDTSSNPGFSPIQSSFPVGASSLPQSASTSGSALFRGRAKTLAALATPAKSSQAEPMPREMQLPKDPFVNGQPIEAYLYKDASECPICFLYYPPHLNKTRCCDQVICSECFVQIKRPDPHPQHADPSAPTPNEEVSDPEELISEPAACPFCVQPEFGVTFEPPQFRRGLTYVNQSTPHPLGNASSAMSSQSSIGSATSNGGRLTPSIVVRRRTTSISATSPGVITTDRVRPDWHQKLAAARAHVTRRSLAASALHAAAYSMGNRGQEGDGRGIGPFGRRGILRRSSGPESPSGTGSSQLGILAMMSERLAASEANRAEAEAAMTPGPRSSSRRSRVDDLEELMMMEAIRLSLASEEERRKREEKDAKKESKKKEKEDKKAKKVAKKTGVYPSSANQSTAGLGTSSDEASSSQLAFNTPSWKGKAADNVDQTASSSSAGDPQEHLERARAQILPEPGAFFTPSPYRPSHLRTLSNASSTTSSIDGSLKSNIQGQGSSANASPNASGVNIASGGSGQDRFSPAMPSPSGTNVEPAYNFRSLDAIMGDDDKCDRASLEGASAERQQPTDSSGSTSSPAQDLDVSMNSNDDDESTGRMDGHTDQASDAIREAPPSFKADRSQEFNDTKHVAVGTEDIARNDVDT